MIQRKLWEQTAIFSSSWDQGPGSELQEGLYDSGARQRDTFLTRECHICTFICYHVFGRRSDIETV